MKKTRILALVLCVSVMLMGAGYAYWSDTLTINNTVTTGELNVEFTSLNKTLDTYGVAAINVVPASINNVKAIAIVSTNLYPGAQVGFTATISNTGTIPAGVDSITFADVADTTLGATLTQLPAAEKNHFLITGTVVYGGTTYTIPAGVTLANINAVSGYLPKQIAAGQSATMNLTLTLDPNLTGNELEKNYLKTNITFNFLQHNDPSL